MPEQIIVKEKKICSCCGKERVIEYGKYIGDKFYCRKCKIEKFTQCDCCGEYYKKEEIISKNNSSYCKYCFQREFTKCNHCGKYLLKSTAHLGENNEYYCSECFNTLFILCNNCGNRGTEESMKYVEEEDTYLCVSCFNKYYWGKIIKKYGYKPQYIFKKSSYEIEENLLYMGFELEMEHNPQEILEKTLAFRKFLNILRTNKLFSFKSDSSIDTANMKGFELVSHPFTLQYAQKDNKYRLKDMIEFLKKNKFSSEESGRCGLHIHLSRDFFSDMDVSKLRIFFSKNRKQIEILSRRKGIGIERYCKFENFSIQDFLNGILPNDRTYAINLKSSENTIELRIFRGTLNYKHFIGTLQFADAISWFVKCHGIGLFVNSTKNRSWDEFIHWCTQEKRYDSFLELYKTLFE